MAESNLPTAVKDRPNERIYISSPFTRRALAAVKRLDAAMRQNEERYGRGQMSHSRYMDVQARANSAIEDLEKSIQGISRSRRGRRNQDQSGPRPKAPVEKPSREKAEAPSASEPAEAAVNEREENEQANSSAPASPSDSALRGGADESSKEPGF